MNITHKRNKLKSAVTFILVFMLLAGCADRNLSVAAVETAGNAELSASAGEATGQPDTAAASESESEVLEVKGQEQGIEDIHQNRAQYPVELLERLDENPELLNFVIDYPNKRYLPGAESLEETIEPGQIPLLIQWDKRWGYCMYGEKMLGINGCGPTCIAMVAAGLTGRTDITPLKVAQYSAANGYLTEDADTSWELMSEGCEEFGISGQALYVDEMAMIETLESGSPIICSVGPGAFTNNGHFIVITGYEDGKFIVNDPNSRVRSARRWKFSELREEILNIWYFSVYDKEAESESDSETAESITTW